MSASELIPVPLGIHRKGSVAVPPDRRQNRDVSTLRRVIETAMDAYVATDRRGRIVDWNGRAEDLFGHAREEILGRSAVALVEKHQRFPVVKALSRVLAQGLAGEKAAIEFDAVTAAGRVFPVECKVWAFDRRGDVQVHMFVRDISARRKAEDFAMGFAGVVEGVSDAMYTRDLRGRLLAWNAAAERMFGWSATEVVGLPSSIVMPDEDESAWHELLERVARGQSVTDGETERLTRSGVVVSLSLHSSPVRADDGRVVAVNTIARDVTERRWMSHALDKTLTALQSAAEEAQASAEITRRFLADAAHQLRTPVAGIRACAETLLRGVEPDDVDRLLTVMIRETSRAGRLVTSLLTIARLDQGAELALDEVDLVAICGEEVERLQLMTSHVSVSLALKHDPGLCLLDEAAVREILSNLGDNALRHARTSISCGIDVADGLVTVRLDEDGKGVPESQAERIFERFVTLDNAGGSGLGLSIARAYARTMGGDLRYDGGFLLSLPRLPGDAPSAGA